MLFSRIQELWQLYAAFCVMSLGSSLGTWLPVMTVMNQWFVRNKSRAMSLAMEGFALGGIIAPLLLAWAIGGADPTESERYGWRTTAMFVGILCLVLALPLSRLVVNRPEEMSLHPDGDAVPVASELQVNPGASPAGDEAEGYTWQEAIRTKTFWFMSIGHAASATAIVTVFVHLGLALGRAGILPRCHRQGDRRLYRGERRIRSAGGLCRGQIAHQADGLRVLRSSIGFPGGAWRWPTICGC